MKLRNFNNLCEKIIFESRYSTWKDSDMEYERYRDSDEYVQDKERSKKYHLENHEKNRLKNDKYEIGKDLQTLIAEKIYSSITNKNALAGYQQIPLNKDYDIIISYIGGNAPASMRYSETIYLSKYDHTGNNVLGDIIENWKCKAGYPDGDIVTYNYENNKWYTFDGKTATEEDIKNNKQQCFEYAKQIADYIKENISDLGKY